MPVTQIHRPFPSAPAVEQIILPNAAGNSSTTCRQLQLCSSDHVDHVREALFSSVVGPHFYIQNRIWYDSCLQHYYLLEICLVSVNIYETARINCLISDGPYLLWLLDSCKSTRQYEAFENRNSLCIAIIEAPVIWENICEASFILSKGLDGCFVL